MAVAPTPGAPWHAWCVRADATVSSRFIDRFHAPLNEMMIGNARLTQRHTQKNDLLSFNQGEKRKQKREPSASAMGRRTRR